MEHLRTKRKISYRLNVLNRDDSDHHNVTRSNNCPNTNSPQAKLHFPPSHFNWLSKQDTVRQYLSSFRPDSLAAFSSLFHLRVIIQFWVTSFGGCGIWKCFHIGLLYADRGYNIELVMNVLILCTLYACMCVCAYVLLTRLWNAILITLALY